MTQLDARSLVYRLLDVLCVEPFALFLHATPARIIASLERLMGKGGFDFSTISQLCVRANFVEVRQWYSGNFTELCAIAAVAQSLRHFPRYLATCSQYRLCYCIQARPRMLCAL